MIRKKEFKWPFIYRKRVFKGVKWRGIIDDINATMDNKEGTVDAQLFVRIETGSTFEDHQPYLIK